ncbi:MAG TPA: hypothetical protein VEZ14_13095 [Dehalococcoidia bacterium]|nr:hypothetical protein [Dehalococcoidia bacterium]
MRTLSGTLTAAQRAASTEPYVTVIAENAHAGIRRLDYTVLDQTGSPIASHDAAVPGDGSLMRVRSDGAGNVWTQRVANPGAGGWGNPWLLLGGGKGNVVACAAKGARVIAVYVDAAATGIKMRESTDNGQTWAAEVAVVTAAAAVVDLAVAYKNSTGDHTIAWVTAATLNAITRTGGAYGAASASGVAVSSFNGVAMTYLFDWSILVTGVEQTTLRRTLWAITYGDGFDKPVGVWDVLLVQQQAESDSLVAYSAPSVAYFDTYRITYVEADTFTGGATRTYRTSLNPLNGWMLGANYVRAPVPVNYAGAQGLALAGDAANGYAYECAPDYVARAPKSVVQLDLSANVVAIDIEEQRAATRGYIELDNTAGTYAGPPAPLQLGNLIAVRWGYRTSAGNEASRMADLWIAATEHRRQGGVSTLRLYVEGAWEQLRRSRQRTQIVHTGADTYAAILTRIFSRAGLSLSTSGSSARARTVAPQFTVHPATSGYEAARQALAFLADRVRLASDAAADLIEPLAAAASTYTYGATHPVTSVQLHGESPPLGEAHAFGAGAFGEAIDYVTAQAMTGSREQQRDLTSTTGAAAAATAAATLRRRALEAPAGRIVCPPNVGQELEDAVDFTDLLINAAAVKRRVRALRWRYDRHGSVYEQTLELGAS